MQDHQRLKCPIIGLFCVFGYNYRMNDKVARIGKYGFTRVCYCDRMQIAIRYGLNDNDVMISQAIDKYCHEHNCSRGNLTRNAIVEKLERDGFLSE